MGNSNLLYLFRAYNAVTNPYASIKEINFSAAVLDQKKVEALAEKKGIQYYVNDIQENASSNIRTYVEESKYGLESEFSAKANVAYKGAVFSAGLDTAVAKKDNHAKNTRYLRIYEEHILYSVCMNMNAEDLKDCLSEAFCKEIQTKEPKYIFEKYGTHMLWNYNVGGSISVDCQYVETSNRSDLEIQADAKAAYKGLSGSASAEAKKKAEDFFSNKTMSVHTRGGKNIGALSEEEFYKEIPTWREGLDKYSVVFQLNKGDTVPIWEFLDDEMSQKYKKAFQEYYKKHLLDLRDKIPFVTDMRVLSLNNDRVSEHLQAGENVVQRNPGELSASNSDLNRNAKGKYIYLLYKLGTDKKRKISDIKIISGQNAPARNGYEKISTDLNEGAGGDYIYLTYCRDANATGIYSLGTYTQTGEISGNWKAITDWNGNAYDLNRNAGGDYIYLARYEDPMLRDIQREIEEFEI